MKIKVRRVGESYEVVTGHLTLRAAIAASLPSVEAEDIETRQTISIQLPPKEKENKPCRA